MNEMKELEKKKKRKRRARKGLDKAARADAKKDEFPPRRIRAPAESCGAARKQGTKGEMERKTKKRRAKEKKSRQRCARQKMREERQ